jgi:ActD protein
VDHGTITLEHGGETARKHFLYGIIAEFEDAHDVVAAAEKTYAAGYRRIDAYTPFPVEDLSEALGHRDLAVPWVMGIGGILGAVSGFGLLSYCLVSAYPLNIGGRPLYGWPHYMPITFEMTVLFTALSGVVGMLMLNQLPMPYHPVFDAPDFEKATSSSFFLCIEATDPKFDREATRQFMETLGAAKVSEVELKK